MNLRRAQHRLMAGGVVDPYSALRAAWDAAGPTLLYSAPRETAYSDGDPVPSATEFASGTYPATQGTASLQPTYVADGIGGRPAFSFDGGDWLQASGFSVPQPCYVVVIAKFANTDTANRQIVSSAAAFGPTIYSRNGLWAFYAGTRVDDGVDDANAHIFDALFDGGSSYLRIDGSTVASGNVGSGGYSGCTLGANDVGDNRWIGLVPEWGIFSTPPTSGQLAAILAAASDYYSIPIS